MNRRTRHARRRSLIAFVCSAIWVSSTGIAQNPPIQVSSLNRERGHTMLAEIKEELKKRYYDPGFHNMDIEARFKLADEKIDQAQSTPQIFGIIAQLLSELNDSHTAFLPPSFSYTVEYGWDMSVIGDRCFVTQIDERGDAEAKGVKIGDEVLKAGGYVVNRSNLRRFRYLYNILRPQPAINLTVKSPSGEVRDLQLLAKITERKRVTNLTDYTEYMNLVRRSETAAHQRRDRFHEVGKELLIWKMRDFDLEKLEVDNVFERVRNFQTLILDLRGNPGGWVKTMLRIVSNLFDRDIKVADIKTRKETKPEISKTRGEKTFKGNLIVLVDASSASAAEMIARLVQIEKRGVVIGDQSMGAVMQSRRYTKQIGIDVVVFYGISITEADVVMSDGVSLEHRGVTPDEIIIPTGADLAAHRDLVLSRAAALSGVTLNPEKAGRLFIDKKERLKAN